MKPSSKTDALAISLKTLWVFSLPMVMVGLGSMFYVFEFLLRDIPSVLTHQLQWHFLVNDQPTTLGQISLISSFFMLGYATCQIPAGIATDTYGPRKVLTISMIACCLATFLFCLTHNMWLGALSRLTLGMFSACAFIAPLTLASRWFSPRYFAMIAGTVQVLGCMGATFGQMYVAKLAESPDFNWVVCLNSIASVGLIIAALFWLGLQDHPHSHNPKPLQRQQTLAALKHLLTRSQTWWIGLSAFACWAPIGVLAELWGPRFLMSQHHLTESSATQHLFWLWMGVACASPLCGWLSDHIGKRVLPSLLLFTLAFITSTLLITQHQLSYVSLDVILFLLGTSAGIQPITFAMVTDQTSRLHIATAIALNNMAIVAGIFIIQPLIGGLMDALWQGDLTPTGLRFYHTSTWQWALSIIPCCSIIGFIGTALGVKETHCQYHAN